MAEITAAMVKELRERTSAGMMECKKALVEANGDMQAAEDIIAKSGHKKAAKSAGRTAAEGRVLVAVGETGAAILEINCETDFVARDESFGHFCQQTVDIALKNGVQEVEKLNSLAFEGNNTVEEARKNLIARLGENVQIRRVQSIKAENNQRFGAYVHHSRIAVLVVIEEGSDELAKDLAMHIAAMKPQYLHPEEIPEAIVAKEKEILMERAKQSGKPENIIEKIVAGQLQKQLSEICLMGQPFFKDPDQTVAAIVKAANAKVLKAIRYEVGEGIDVVKMSFEEEVAQVRGNT